jgi:hypothetical protein
MFRIRRIVLLSAIALLMVGNISCILSGDEKGKEVSGNTQSSQNTSISKNDIKPQENISVKPIIYKDLAGHSIDYSNPDLYLKSGNQSELNLQNLLQIQGQVPIANHDLSAIAAIFKWKNSSFKSYAAGGVNVGKMTANQLMETKQLSGCHDHGLLLVSVLRKFGFPAVMVDAAGVQWALNYNKGIVKGFSGHIFVEIYSGNKWILVNSTSGEYTAEYNPADPVIPMKNPDEKIGYYVLFKGLDPEDYGITNIDKLNGYMKSFAEKIYSVDLTAPSYKIQQLPLK